MDTLTATQQDTLETVALYCKLVTGPGYVAAMHEWQTLYELQEDGLVCHTTEALGTFTDGREDCGTVWRLTDAGRELVAA